jgi:pilus assembly protein Flp/PilA
MQNLIRKARRLWREETGVIAIEYGLMAVLISLTLVVGAGLLGTGLNNLFTDIAACFGNGTGTCPR